MNFQSFGSWVQTVREGSKVKPPNGPNCVMHCTATLTVGSKLSKKGPNICFEPQGSKRIQTAPSWSKAFHLFLSTPNFCACSWCFLKSSASVPFFDHSNKVTTVQLDLQCTGHPVHCLDVQCWTPNPKQLTSVQSRMTNEQD